MHGMPRSTDSTAPARGRSRKSNGFSTPRTRRGCGPRCRPPSIRPDLPGGPLPVDADAGRLVQVFGNLLHNAARYTAPGGRIRLASTRDGDHVVVRVSDNGTGIPRDMLGAIFEMVTQVDSSLDDAWGRAARRATVGGRIPRSAGTAPAAPAC